MAKRKSTAKETAVQKDLPDSDRDKMNPWSASDKFHIVGMGASVGGLESFNKFFNAIPGTPDMAFVIVQHLNPTHKSLKVQLLQNHTQMVVTEVEDNTKVVPDPAYFIPPNRNMAIFWSRPRPEYSFRSAGGSTDYHKEKSAVIWETA